MQAAQPLPPKEHGAGMLQGTIHLGSPGDHASQTGAILGPMVLPGYHVLPGCAGCRIALLNSYLQIQFLRCGKKLSKGEDNKLKCVGVWDGELVAVQMLWWGAGASPLHAGAVCYHLQGLLPALPCPSGLPPIQPNAVRAPCQGHQPLPSPWWPGPCSSLP